MTNPRPSRPPSDGSVPSSPDVGRSPRVDRTKIQDDRYARLRAEAAAPYRGLRQFIYLTCGASGAIGGFIFLLQILAGRDVAAALPNLGVQVVVVALMVWLFRIDRPKSS